MALGTSPAMTQHELRLHLHLQPQMHRVGLPALNHWQAAVLKDVEHRQIVGERIGLEISQPVGAGDLDDLLHQQIAHAAALIAIDDGEGEFCPKAVGRRRRARNS